VGFASRALPYNCAARGANQAVVPVKRLHNSEMIVMLAKMSDFTGVLDWAAVRTRSCGSAEASSVSLAPIQPATNRRALGRHAFHAAQIESPLVEGCLSSTAIAVAQKPHKI